ncbi:MAG: hypothetical protein ACP5RV_07415 [Thiomonas sp.]
MNALIKALLPAFNRYCAINCENDGMAIAASYVAITMTTNVSTELRPRGTCLVDRHKVVFRILRPQCGSRFGDYVLHPEEIKLTFAKRGRIPVTLPA